MKRVSLLLSLLILLFLPSLQAQQVVSFSQLMQAKEARIAAGTKLSGALHVILGRYQESRDLTRTALTTEAESSLQKQDGNFAFDPQGRIGLTIRCTDIGEVVTALQALGFVESGRVDHLLILEGFLPVAQLANLDQLALPAMLSVRGASVPILDTGSVDGQADTTMEAYRVRGTGPSNFDGTGINIGVLSDSYDDLGGAAAGIGSGDLPAAGVTVIQDATGTSDEGRAMLELIHDIAPGSDLFFATAFGGEANFATNIQALATAGCEVIVDDVVYFGEPFFQDGIVAQAVDAVTNNDDAIYFSSAGNRATQAYENTAPTFAVDPLTTANALDFDPGAGVDFYQSFTLNDGERVRISLQWPDPWFTAAGVDTDIDIAIFDATFTTLLASSTNDNIALQAPAEFVDFTDPTADLAPDNYNIIITLFAGPNPGRLKYVNFGVQNLNEFDTNSPTVNPHAAAAGGVAVAAAPYFQLAPEAFTSHGPSTFFFDAAGTPLAAAEVRQTPDFTCSDGINNTFFGTDIVADTDVFPNFFGTSAAAPNAAAVAALIRQANPAANRDAIYNLMFTSAANRDLDAAGFDNITGNGLIDAYSPIFNPGTPANLDIFDGLETEVFSEAWEISSTNFGKVIVNPLQSPSLGGFHITMDTWFGNNTPPSRNEAILHFDATNQANIMLSFDQREEGDEDDFMPVIFTGSVDADGVALSVDGNTWYRLFDLTGGNSTNTYNFNTIDLSTFAAANALTLGSDVQIKFQQVDGFPFPNDGFAFDNINVQGTPLPVTFLSFSAQQNGERLIGIDWATSREENHAFFTLEKSANGEDFYPITVVQGEGDAEVRRDYRFDDHNPLIGMNHYRLKQTDINGSETYSDIQSVRFAGSMQAVVFPNPSSELLQLQYQSSSDQALRIRILDLNGRLITHMNRSLQLGMNQFEIPVASLAAGVYQVQLQTATQTEQLRFVKR
ncbi:MAG: T9SS type A sorting domain-containing protein [Bacteroidota bacterium]